MDRREGEIRARLLELGQERASLLSELASLSSNRGQQDLSPIVEPVPKTPKEKLGLFRKRFVALSDVYPLYWENRGKGTKGYYPVCEAVFEDGKRLRPSELYSRFGVSKFKPLDDGALEDHLRGQRVIGTYSIQPGDTCIFLAADFDGEGWQECASSYVDAAAALGFKLLVEISRSGNGAHAWLFFAETVSARLARGLGACFLVEAAASISKLNLASYDRSRLEVADLRLRPKRIRIRFTGQATREQRLAARSFEASDIGVVVAPPGAGKTVIACRLICDWKFATVVLVNRRSLMQQWRQRLLEFTSLPKERIGHWGGGKAKLTGIVDIVMIQSLSRAEAPSACLPRVHSWEKATI